VHVTELSWTKRIAKPSDVLKPEQEIEAVVLGINREEQKISLGVPRAAQAEQAVLGSLKPGKDLVALQHAFDQADEANK
jgi:ribosomal protein S1